MRLYQPHLRLLRRVQAKVQHQAMEDLHRLLQLLAHRRYHRREDLYDARWSQPRPQLHGADQARDATNRCEYSTVYQALPRVFSTKINMPRFRTVDFSAICCGPILIRTSPDGVRTIEVSVSRSVLMWYPASCRNMIWTSSVVPIRSWRTGMSSSQSASS